MHSLSRRAYWFVSALWLMTLFTAVVWGRPVPVRFETNDDFWMLQIASGRYTGEPSEFLIYMHVGIGLLLKTLFGWFPLLNSYVALFLALHVSFAASVIYVLRRQAEHTWGWTLPLAIAVLFHGFVFFRLQFTTTAFVGAAAALLLALDAVGKNSVHAGLQTFLGVALWGVAFMVRAEAAVLAAVLAAPAFVYLAIRERAVKPMARFAGYAVLLSVTLLVAERGYLAKNPEWGDFLRFNRTRGRIHVAPGYAYDKESAALYSRLGWSENDVQIFQQWFYPDPRVHAPEKIETVARELRRPLSWTAAVQRWLRNLSERRFAVVCALALPLGIFICQRSLAMPFSVAFLLSCALQVFLQATARLPPRVLLPLLFGPSLFVVPLLDREPVRRNPRAAWIWLIVMVLLVSRSMRFYARMKQQHEEMRAAWELAQQQEVASTAAVLALWADDWPVEWARVEWRMPPAKTGPRYLSLSSLTQSPHHWAVMRQLGLEDLVMGLLTRDDLMLACRSGRLPYLAQYVREHYGQDMRAEDRGGLYERRIFKLTRSVVFDPQS